MCCSASGVPFFGPLLRQTPAARYGDTTPACAISKVGLFEQVLPVPFPWYSLEIGDIWRAGLMVYPRKRRPPPAAPRRVRGGAPVWSTGALPGKRYVTQRGSGVTATLAVRFVVCPGAG